jgi:hypothetical protein
VVLFAGAFPFLFLWASFRWRLASLIDDPFGMFGLPTAEIGDDFVQTVVAPRDVLIEDSILGRYVRGNKPPGVRRNGSRIFIPKGLRKAAQGCRSERLPWENGQAVSFQP